MENIFFDVDQPARLNRTEQAHRLEETECRIDDVQRAAANDPATFKQGGSAATIPSGDAAPEL